MSWFSETYTGTEFTTHEWADTLKIMQIPRARKGLSPTVAAKEHAAKQALSEQVQFLLDSMDEGDFVRLGPQFLGRPRHSRGGHQLEMKKGWLYLHCSFTEAYTLNAPITSKSPYFPLSDHFYKSQHAVEVFNQYFPILSDRYEFDRETKAFKAEAHRELLGRGPEVPSPDNGRGLEGPVLGD